MEEMPLEELGESVDQTDQRDKDTAPRHNERTALLTFRQQLKTFLFYTTFLFY